MTGFNIYIYQLRFNRLLYKIRDLGRLNTKIPTLISLEGSPLSGSSNATYITQHPWVLSATGVFNLEAYLIIQQ